MITKLLTLLVLLVSIAPAPAWAQDERTLPVTIVPQRPLIHPHGQPEVRVSAVEVIIDITDQVATTEFVITVFNPGSRQVEAELVMPVPEGIAIRQFGLDSLGDEPTARLLPADEARRLYNSIVRRMVDPGLLEFVGSAAIKSSVFPVPAGGTQTLRLTYEQVLPSSHGRVDFVLLRSGALEQTGVEWSITATVRTSSPLATIYSPSHRMDITKPTGNRAKVVVLGADEPGSFLMSWLTASDSGLPLTVIACPDPNDPAAGGYFLLLAAAPERSDDQPVQLRELTIVIDRSGSMRGDKMTQAIEAAKNIIADLNEGELFNIFDYADRVERFAEAPVVRTAETLAAANDYLDAIKARGGTNIHDALVEALRQRPPDGAVPLVLFLTDGLPTVGVVDEAAIKQAAIDANAANRRVFTFGVGMDVNTPLLSGLASSTRASATFVLPGQSIEAAVGAVAEKLDGPVMTTPKLKSFINGLAEIGASPTRDVLPAALPDLFAGEQLIVLGRYTGDREIILSVTGTTAEGERTRTVTLNPADASLTNSYIPRLWAQRQIASMIDSIRQAGANGTKPDQELVNEIVRLSLEFGILTEYTAFLAAEEADFSGMRFDPDDMSWLLESTAPASRSAREGLIRRAVDIRTGTGAVNQARNSQKMLGDSVYYSFYDQNMNEVRITNVQTVQGRGLYNRKGRWIESVLLSMEDEDPDQTVEFDTPEYELLLDDLITQNRQALLANRGDIYLLNRGKRILVKNPG